MRVLKRSEGVVAWCISGVFSVFGAQNTRYGIARERE